MHFGKLAAQLGRSACFSERETGSGSSGFTEKDVQDGRHSKVVVAEPPTAAIAGYMFRNMTAKVH